MPVALELKLSAKTSTRAGTVTQLTASMQLRRGGNGQHTRTPDRIVVLIAMRYLSRRLRYPDTTLRFTRISTSCTVNENILEYHGTYIESYRKVTVQHGAIVPYNYRTKQVVPQASDR